MRLEQGDYERVSSRVGEPLALARALRGGGRRLVHVVDLDGARAGVLRPELVAGSRRPRGRRRFRPRGGIRSVADAEALLAAGAARVVVGTAAFADDALERSRRWASRSSSRSTSATAACGSRAGRERRARRSTTRRPLPAAGVRRLLCTAIERDGTLGGPDLELLQRIVQRSDARIVAAGGIGSG